MNKLLELLTENGIKQSKIASVSELSKETINRICKNHTQGSPVTQVSLVKALNQLSGKEYTVQDVFYADK
jgi:DNA-binding XRE family transcriptional regulator